MDYSHGQCPVFDDDLGARAHPGHQRREVACSLGFRNVNPGHSQMISSFYFLLVLKAGAAKSNETGSWRYSKCRFSLSHGT